MDQAVKLISEETTANHSDNVAYVNETIRRMMQVERLVERAGLFLLIIDGISANVKTRAQKAKTISCQIIQPS